MRSRSLRCCRASSATARASGGKASNNSIIWLFVSSSPAILYLGRACRRSWSLQLPDDPVTGRHEAAGDTPPCDLHRCAAPDIGKHCAVRQILPCREIDPHPVFAGVERHSEGLRVEPPLNDVARSGGDERREAPASQR